MMKRKLSRAIAAVLTFAMAFTLLAVPASAKELTADDAKDVAALITTKQVEAFSLDEEVYVITTRAYHELKNTYDALESDTTGDTVEAELTAEEETEELTDDDKWAAVINAAITDEGGMAIYSNDNDVIPAGALVGLRNTYGKIVWLDEEDLDALAASTDTQSINWLYGTITAGSDVIETLSYTGNDNVKTSTHEIIGGFAVAGVVATLFLASNPEIIENAANAVQNFVNQITGNTAAA